MDERLRCAPVPGVAHRSDVDLGLTTPARADAMIAEGRLITKREAVARMPGLGVPAELAEQIARRRRGEVVELSEAEIRERAVLVRGLMRDGLRRLLPTR